jgi:hypothetical protein
MTTPIGSMDPLLTLALALHNTRGGYALLLGSGLSSAAGVPTGWGIVLDLIQRIATAEGRDAAQAAEPDSASWFQTRYGSEPNYSELIGRLAPTTTERRELLRGYFEPTPEEREEGKKQPTLAHRAIARLVRDGYVRVILTTNFDQLTETALRDEGVTPAVISTADQVAGMMPLHLAPITVIKIHGDYIDTRIRNTEEELAEYPAPFNELLDRVLDEYGLIVCGWSATWDPALRRAVERCPNRRFTTFWATRGELSEEARALVAHRRAAEIDIEDADEFFVDVSEKLAALDSIRRPHPLTTPVAVATLKRYLPRPEQRIRLHDLVLDETEQAVRRVSTVIDLAVDPNPEGVVKNVMLRIEAACETLNALLATGAYWGESHHRSLWIEVLERLSNRSHFQERLMGSGYDVWRALFRYPAFLAFYAAGLAACARGKGAEETLLDVLLRPRIKFRSDGRFEPPADTLNAQSLLPINTAQAALSPRAFTPVSDHLFKVLSPIIAPLFADEDEYADAFDRWEYLIAMAYCDKNVANPHESFGAPCGRIVWRREYRVGHPTVKNLISEEVQRENNDWLLLRRGLFAGRSEKLAEMMAAYENLLSRRGMF